MPKTVLRPKNLEFQPRPRYPYSPGAKGGNFVFTPGQVAWHARGEVAGLGGVRARTWRTRNNVKRDLAGGGRGPAIVGRHGGWRHVQLVMLFR